MINNSVHTERIRAGRRTYFIDVKKMLDEDHYLIITESRKNKDGEQMQFSKTKIFVYPEDINKFTNALQASVEKVKELMPDYDFDQYDRKEEE